MIISGVESVRVSFYKGLGYHVVADVSVEAGCTRVHLHSFPTKERAEGMVKRVKEVGTIDTSYWLAAEDFDEGLMAMEVNHDYA